MATGDTLRTPYLSSVLLLCLVFSWFSIGQAAELSRVFVVHSYDKENLASEPQDTGLVQGLADYGFVAGETLLIERFFMDTKQTYTRPEQIKARGNEALARIKAFQPDLVITVDDNAARTVMLPLVDSAIPQVFTGINIRPEIYNQRREFMVNRLHPGHNVTGVYEKLYIAKSVQVMKEIVPNLRKIVFIVDDSPTGDAIKQQMENELFADNSALLYSIRQVGKFSEYKQLIRQIDTDPEIGAYYPVAARLVAEDGGMVTGRDILSWTLGHTRKPALSVNYFVCKLGAFGGVSVDFTAMGRQAGHKAAMILKGQPPARLAIEDAAKYALVFNVARAGQLGMILPPELLAAADHVYNKMGLTVAPKPFHLLIVQSNEQGVGAGADIETGLLVELGRRGFVEGDNLQVHRLYMQTRRTYLTQGQLHQQGLAVLAEVDEVEPDLVITLGDVAAQEVMLPLVDSSYPVLFGGINVPPEEYNSTRKFMVSRAQPGHNITGVTCEFLYKKTLETVQVAFPEARAIVLINSGNSRQLEVMKTILQQEAAAGAANCRFSSIRIESALTLKAFKRLLLKYNEDPAVDLISAVNPVGLTREDGTVNPLAETLSWLFAHQTKPGFTFCDNWVRYGYLMAAGFDFEKTGRQLGQLASRVLRGADPAELPIQRPADPYISVNLARARQLGVELPVDLLEAAHKVYFTVEPNKAH